MLADLAYHLRVYSTIIRISQNVNVLERFLLLLRFLIIVVKSVFIIDINQFDSWAK